MGGVVLREFRHVLAGLIQVVMHDEAALIGEDGAEQRFGVGVFKAVLREQAQLVFRHDGRGGNHVVDHAAKVGDISGRAHLA